MLSSVRFIALIPMASVFVGGTVDAAQKRHHPWLLVKKAAPKAESVAPVQEPTPITKSAPTVTVEKSPVVAKTTEKPIAKTSDAGKKIAKQAMNYRGTRYKFGGTSKKGMDCSGLVARIYADLKMRRVPRMSSDLYQSGRPVHMAELQPGDLVFFKNTYKRGVSHVGVYAGHNKFVHAANHKRGVTVTSLADPYYQIHYAGARRLY